MTDNTDLLLERDELHRAVQELMKDGCCRGGGFEDCAGNALTG